MAVVAHLRPLHVSLQTLQVGVGRVGPLLADHQRQVGRESNPEHSLDLVEVLRLEAGLRHGLASLLHQCLHLAAGQHNHDAAWLVEDEMDVGVKM